MDNLSCFVNMNSSGNNCFPFMVESIMTCYEIHNSLQVFLSLFLTTYARAVNRRCRAEIPIIPPN